MQRELQKRKVQVEIFGDKYTIKGNEEEKHIRHIAECVDNKMILIGQRYPHLSIKQIAVLAALNFADELTKVKDDYEKLLQILEEEKMS